MLGDFNSEGSRCCVAPDCLFQPSATEAEKGDAAQEEQDAGGFWNNQRIEAKGVDLAVDGAPASDLAKVIDCSGVDDANAGAVH